MQQPRGRCGRRIYRPGQLATGHTCPESWYWFGLPPVAPLDGPTSPLEAARAKSSVANDLKKLAGAIVDDPPDAASFIAHAITGGKAGLQPPVVSRVVRMSPLISPLRAGGGWAPPKGYTVAQFQYLCQIDMDAVMPIEIRFITDYCTFWLEDRAPNQPI